ncbi:hypothetical protein [Cupriavidus sp. PET2-C1]
MDIPPACGVTSGFLSRAGALLLNRGPTRDDVFNGPVGAHTAAVLLFDEVAGVVGLAGFCYMQIANPAARRYLWAIAALRDVAIFALWGIAMRILREGYSVHG